MNGNAITLGDVMTQHGLRREDALAVLEALKAETQAPGDANEDLDTHHVDTQMTTWSGPYYSAEMALSPLILGVLRPWLVRLHPLAHCLCLVTLSECL